MVLVVGRLGLVNHHASAALLVMLCYCHFIPFDATLPVNVPRGPTKAAAATWHDNVFSYQ